MGHAVAASLEAQTGQHRRAGTLLAAILAGLFGLAILFVVGFAQPAALHDTAHDSRHAAAFPCH